MQDDAVLAKAFRAGDTFAFEELYSRYVRSVYTLIYFKTHHQATAEDLVSQTFLQALERFDSFDSKKGTFKTWIYQIARNLVIDHYRTAHPNQDIESAWDLASDDDVSRDADTALKVERIQDALKDLKPSQRDTVLLRVWYGLSFAEIADALGTTEAACKMTYKRTVETLQHTLLLLFLLLFSFL